MKITTAPTIRVTLYMAGDLATAHRVVREFCYREGACFTISPTRFIYTGGEEDGIEVGLVNYPRFPIEPEELASRMYALALQLLPALNQRTALIVGPTETEWIVLEPPGASAP